MRMLIVSDLHYALKQFDWVTSVADEYDVVGLGGGADGVGDFDFGARAGDGFLDIVWEYQMRALSSMFSGISRCLSVCRVLPVTSTKDSAPTIPVKNKSELLDTSSGRY